jgi:hypothetical protein
MHSSALALGALVTRTAASERREPGSSRGSMQVCTYSIVYSTLRATIAPRNTNLTELARSRAAAAAATDKTCTAAPVACTFLPWTYRVQPHNLEIQGAQSDASIVYFGPSRRQGQRHLKPIGYSKADHNNPPHLIWHIRFAPTVRSITLFPPPSLSPPPFLESSLSPFLVCILLGPHR